MTNVTQQGGEPVMLIVLQLEVPGVSDVLRGNLGGQDAMSGCL